MICFFTSIFIFNIYISFNLNLSVAIKVNNIPILIRKLFKYLIIKNDLIIFLIYLYKHNVNFRKNNTIT